MGAGAAINRLREEKNLLFVNKEKQKTLSPGVSPASAGGFQESKVLCFFFSKRMLLLFATTY